MAGAGPERYDIEPIVLCKGKNHNNKTREAAECGQVWVLEGTVETTRQASSVAGWQQHKRMQGGEALGPGRRLGRGEEYSRAANVPYACMYLQDHTAGHDHGAEGKRVRANRRQKEAWDRRVDHGTTRRHLCATGANEHHPWV